MGVGGGIGKAYWPDGYVMWFLVVLSERQCSKWPSDMLLVIAHLTKAKATMAVHI